MSGFTIRAGDRVPFVARWCPSNAPPPLPTDPNQALVNTERFWRDWAGGCEHVGDFHDEIHSSLRVLKAPTHAPPGGIVAAPTTSLPETIGGSRNWDSRYCWLRDATTTLNAMLSAGTSRKPRRGVRGL